MPGLLDCPRVETFRLRFPPPSRRELTLGTGVHAIGRDAAGQLALADDPGAALVLLCADRRGLWLRVEGARTVHVNGRPVRRMAMLRVGDSIYVEGAELLLLGARPPGEREVPGLFEADARVVLRGVGGHCHGRSFTLDRPRLVGRAPECDIRIDNPAFAERHARIEWQGGRVLLRDLAGDGSVLNGEAVRDAVLLPGDQLVFDAHHRFVVEGPDLPVHNRSTLDPGDDAPEQPVSSAVTSAGGTRRLPWLLLAALLLAGALSALLLLVPAV